MPFKLLQKLDEEAANVAYEKATETSPHARGKCDAAMASFRRLRDAVRDLVPIVEQNKGLTKGLELAVPIIGQFKVLIKSSFEKGELGKEEAAQQIQLITKVESAISDSARQRKDELIRAAGKVDGIYEAAMKSLEQVKDYLTALARQERFIAENPNLFETAKEPTPQEKLVEALAKKQRGRPKRVNALSAPKAKEANKEEAPGDGKSKLTIAGPGADVIDLKKVN